MLINHAEERLKTECFMLTPLENETYRKRKENLLHYVLNNHDKLSLEQNLSFGA